MTAFVFATCLPRSMPQLKQELARTRPDLRLAYSRPGLLTMRTDAPPGAAGDPPEPRGMFVRASGRSLGFAETPARVVELASSLPDARLRVHVFARDPVDPDEQPDDVEMIDSWRREIVAAIGPRALTGDDANLGDTVLDVVLPPAQMADRVLVGWHTHDAARGRAPGGVRRVPVPDDVPSRAFAKLEEALAWSGMPLEEGDTVVEIGAAPGGAAMALLRRGAHVIGIDPARMDPRVMAFAGAHGPFRHLGVHAERVRTRDLPEHIDWLVLDANVAPYRAMIGYKHLLTLRQASIRGVLFTLKLNDAKVVEDLPSLVDEVRALAQVSAVRVTQLPSAHQEVVVWADRAAIAAHSSANRVGTKPR